MQSAEVLIKMGLILACNDLRRLPHPAPVNVSRLSADEEKSRHHPRRKAPGETPSWGKKVCVHETGRPAAPLGRGRLHEGSD